MMYEIWEVRRDGNYILESYQDWYEASKARDALWFVEGRDVFLKRGAIGHVMKNWRR